MAATQMPTLTQIRRRFGALPVSSYKQMGLRRVRDALALGDRNPERTAELHAQGWLQLQYAEEIARRASEAA